MISKFPNILSKSSLFQKSQCAFAASMKKYDFADPLIFKKLLTEEEIMVIY